MPKEKHIKPSLKSCKRFSLSRFLPALLILEVHHFLRHQTQSSQAIWQDLKRWMAGTSEKRPGKPLIFWLRPISSGRKITGSEKNALPLEMTPLFNICGVNLKKKKWRSGQVTHRKTPHNQVGMWVTCIAPAIRISTKRYQFGLGWATPAAGPQLRNGWCPHLSPKKATEDPRHQWWNDPWRLTECWVEWDVVPRISQSMDLKENLQKTSLLHPNIRFSCRFFLMQF